LRSFWRKGRRDPFLTGVGDEGTFWGEGNTGSGDYGRHFIVQSGTCFLQIEKVFGYQRELIND